MSTIYNAIIAFADWAWGIPMLIWLVGGGIVRSCPTASKTPSLRA